MLYDADLKMAGFMPVRKTTKAAMGQVHVVLYPIKNRKTALAFLRVIRHAVPAGNIIVKCWSRNKKRGLAKILS